MDYYVMTGEECTGPFSSDQVSGQIKPESLLKREGEQEWRPKTKFPELLALATPRQTEALVPAQPHGVTGIIPMPWNPLAIVWLGLLFTPIWSGVMAALNERRFRGQRNITPALWIAGLWFLADFVLYPWLGLGLIATWLTTVACLWLLWDVVLVEQRKDFARFPSEQNMEHYRLPVLAGLPALLMLCFQAYSAATTTLSPYEVCQRFQNARTADRTPLVTGKMKELLDDIERFQQAGGTMSWALPKQSKDVFTLPPDKTLVPIKVTFNNDYRYSVFKGDAYLQLIPDAKQGYLVDDIVTANLQGTAFNSMHASRSKGLVYNTKPSSTAMPLPPPRPIRSLTSPTQNTQKTDLRPYVVPTAIIAKTALPWIGKFLAMLGIGALALSKGFFSTAPKREESK